MNGPVRFLAMKCRMSLQNKGQAVVVFVLLAFGLVYAEDALPRKGLPIPADLAAKIELSCKLGYELYLIDQVSAVGTDALFEKIGAPAAGKNLGGYIAVREGDNAGRPLQSWIVAFFTNEETPRIAYNIHIEKDKKAQIEEFQPPQAAPPGLLLLFRARQNALKAVQPFQQPINAVVLPAAVIGKQGILVELLAATQKPNLMVLGKHYRVIISNNGHKVDKVEPLSKGMLEIPTADDKGQKFTSIFATQLVTDYPLETHVFANLLHKIPIYVMTNKGLWLVDKGTIILISKDVPGKKKE
jgi:hypothetical protein